MSVFSAGERLERLLDLEIPADNLFQRWPPCPWPYPFPLELSFEFADLPRSSPFFFSNWPSLRSFHKQPSFQCIRRCLVLNLSSDEFVGCLFKRLFKAWPAASRCLSTVASKVAIECWIFFLWAPKASLASPCQSQLDLQIVKLCLYLLFFLFSDPFALATSELNFSKASFNVFLRTSSLARACSSVCCSCISNAVALASNDPASCQ